MTDGFTDSTQRPKSSRSENILDQLTGLCTNPLTDLSVTLEKKDFQNVLDNSNEEITPVTLLSHGNL